MGMHIARLVRMPNPSLFLAVIVFLSSFLMAVGDQKEIESLLAFRNSFMNPSVLSNWKASTPPCTAKVANWVGVVCNERGKVTGLKLDNMGLKGVVNVQSLGALQDLRTLSVMNNNLEGKIPEMKKLIGLQSLLLSNNHLSGDIPDDAFEGMKSLRTVFLANNIFHGKFPSSLTTLPNLSILKMEGNGFSGSVPEFPGNSLKMVNLANNQFEGLIPKSLSKMPANMFSGNRNLCGPPLVKKCVNRSPPPGPPPSPSPSIMTNPTALTIALIVVSVALLVVILLLICFLLRRRQQSETSDEEEFVGESYNYNPPPPSVQAEKKAPEPSPGGGAANVKRSELTFLTVDVQMFDLQDLLKASAEVLGSGKFGASYKAAIGRGETVVVKNYKQMSNVGKDEFHEHMRKLGKLNHPNLLPLLAYYYRKEEKLLVTNFMVDGSLASHLHANHSNDKPSLDWQTRWKIIKGVIKGLAYLYNELPTLVVPHGHLKSSNVLLDKHYEPLLCDYALRSVINQDQAHAQMIAYKSPEYAKSGKINRKTDVWCLGILILEILTGRFPENYLSTSYNSGMSISSWVNKMVKEKKIGQVFDKEMKGEVSSRGEMINVLKIGLSCCEEDSEARPELKEVVKEIEELKGGDEDDDDDDSSSTIGEVNVYISGKNGKSKGGSSSFDR
ncbi:pollen receptor like kinase 4 [Hibiscus trionum]|uniref:non-specific serine/threonine protein kinase n=1 Tax=Hibiscus trionum TaxID=183268 RepID=A0A9W7I9L6_HIBTR|nr:pollen receptor like kinase 4 [Hibiscus trionum]